jgi:1,4-dihydroxy-2-naphthoate octaprenyltransferase
MDEAAPRSTFADRLGEPPTRLQWLLFLVIDAVTIAGVATGLLGVAWLAVGPTVIAAAVYFLAKALEKPAPPSSAS